MKLFTSFGTLCFFCFITQSLTKIHKDVHLFYYAWYDIPRNESLSMILQSSESVDPSNSFKHWNHEVLPHWEDRINLMYPNIRKKFSPPDHLHSPFYPLSGPYSSVEELNLLRQFEEINSAGSTVIAFSWWGPRYKSYATDTQGVSTDIVLEKMLQTADSYRNQYQIKIVIHLEPYPSRTVESVKEDIEYLYKTYEHYKSLYKDHSNRILCYCYDSYHIPAHQWIRLLGPIGDLTIRNTKYDVVMIGLWLHSDHGRELINGGFDGIYTYFGTDGFSYGSTSSNWKKMCQFCQNHDKLCVISVSPGYDDSQIRPWNTHNRRDREEGDYYARQWSQAILAAPDIITVTSFNEWGEGMQIESAIPKHVPSIPNRIEDGWLYDTPRTYSHYGDDGPYKYINMTKIFTTEYLEYEGKEEL